MSTTTEAAPAASNTKPFTFTRGGAYLLEALLQKTEPFTTPRTQRRANRLWAKVRKANPCKVQLGGELVDMERPYVKASGDTDIQWEQKKIERSQVFDDWKDEQVTIGFTPKDIDLLEKTALKWAIKNRQKCWPENNQHTLSVFNNFPAVFDDDTDEEDAPATSED